MNVYKNLYAIVLVIILMIPIHASSQGNNENNENPGYCFTIVPQYSIIGTIKFELDKQIGNTSNWLIIAPSFAISYDDFLWNINYDTRTGIGLNLGHRLYLNQNNRGPYFQYGAVYNYTQLKYTGTHWTTSVVDGTEILVETDGEVKDHLHKYGGNLILGWQILFSNRLVFDLYGGMGFRHSSMTSTSVQSINDISGRDGILSPRYKGILPVGGWRIGFYF